MACILHIETSTKACSVALSENGSLIFHQEDLEGPNHAVVCGVFVDEALSFATSHAIPVDAVAVSEGPGSYTGLRIPARALRADQETGQLGVYRLSGTQAEWVPVELVYSGSDYYLIRSEHEGELSQLGQAKELRPGDQVLVRGKDIYDGKVIE